MQTNHRKMYKNKFFIIFALLILMMFPSTLYMQSDKDKTIVITSIGIDKIENGYKLTTLAVIPKSTSDISANLEIFNSEGKTISNCLDKISLETGKKIGLAHCDSIIVSKPIMEDNIKKITDFFIRTANLATNANIIGTDGKAEELIRATKNTNNILDLSLKNIMTHQEKNTMLKDVTIEKFYRTNFTQGKIFYIPILSIEKSINNQLNSYEQKSNDSSSSDTTQKLKLKNESKIAILYDGKFSRTIDEDELFIYSLLSSNSDYLRIVIDNVTDNIVNNSTEIYQQVDKFIFPTYSLKNNIPLIKYDIWLSLLIDEIITNNEQININSLNNYLTPEAKKSLESSTKEKLNRTLKIMKESKQDLLYTYEKFNAFHPIKWKKYIDSLKENDSYLNNLNIEISLHLNYVI